MSDKKIVGVFEDDEKLIHALEKLKEQNVLVEDVYSPFPIHGLDELLGIKRSRLPYVTFGAGVLGGVFALFAMSWISSISWPIVIGGKPFNSIPAFIPITFEITVLSAALITTGAFLFRSKLFPGQKKYFDLPGVTDNLFAILVAGDDATLKTTKDIFNHYHAKEIKEG
jgi:hypothetical protein